MFKEHWSPKIIAELYGQHVKLAKLFEEFVWHSHENQDEMFLVISGVLKMEFRNGIQTIKPGEFIVVPTGTEHRPIAEQEVSVMLFEPTTTLNTGDAKPTNLTKTDIDRI